MYQLQLEGRIRRYHGFPFPTSTYLVAAPGNLHKEQLRDRALVPSLLAALCQ